MKKILLILGLGLFISCCNDDIPCMVKQTNNKYIEYRYDYYGEVIETRETTNNLTTENIPYNSNLIGDVVEDTIQIHYHTFGGSGNWEGKIRLIELKQTSYYPTN